MIVTRCDGLIVLGGVCAGGRLFYRAKSFLNYGGWHTDSAIAVACSLRAGKCILSHPEPCTFSELPSPCVPWPLRSRN